MAAFQYTINISYHIYLFIYLFIYLYSKCESFCHRLMKIEYKPAWLMLADTTANNCGKFYYEILRNV